MSLRAVSAFSSHSCADSVLGRSQSTWWEVLLQDIWSPPGHPKSLSTPVPNDLDVDIERPGEPLL